LVSGSGIEKKESHGSFRETKREKGLNGEPSWVLKEADGVRSNAGAKKMRKMHEGGHAIARKA